MIDKFRGVESKKEERRSKGSGRRRRYRGSGGRRRVRAQTLRTRRERGKSVTS